MELRLPKLSPRKVKFINFCYFLLWLLLFVFPKNATSDHIDSSSRRIKRLTSALVSIMSAEMSDLETKHICSGTILAPKIILTAAHCLYDYSDDKVIKRDPKSLLIAVRIRNLLSNPPSENVYYVEKSIDPGFNPQTLANDIGIIVAETPIDFAKHRIDAMRLPPFSLHPGAYCMGVGWGDIHQTEDNPVPTTLSYYHVQVTEPELCEIEKDDALGYLCTVHYEGGVCKGDSGGPLVCGKFVSGVVSHGKECGHESLFSGVCYHIDWICSHGVSCTRSELCVNLYWNRGNTRRIDYSYLLLPCMLILWETLKVAHGVFGRFVN